MRRCATAPLPGRHSTFGGNTRTRAEPNRRGSRHPFHELANVIVTPHNSGWTAGMVRRRWDEIADNIGRFFRGEPLINLVASM